MYVIYFSPLQMVPDYPDAYESSPQEFAFIKEIPTVWDDTRVIDAVPGDYITVARRSGDTWFVGSMTDESPRLLKIPLDFLDPTTEYVAEIFTDGVDADQNPEHVQIEKTRVSSSSVLEIALAPGGGYAARLIQEEQ
jgi:alpha-glucosidase